VPTAPVQRHMQQGQAQACAGSGHAGMAKGIRAGIAVITEPIS